RRARRSPERVLAARAAAGRLPRLAADDLDGGRAHARQRQGHRRGRPRARVGRGRVRALQCAPARGARARGREDAGGSGVSDTFAIGGDLPVGRLGFGAMRITGAGIWGEPADPDECRRVLRRAVELGVTLIDTADSYGPHVSERLIGETLAPYPDDLVVATKAGFQ